MRVVIRGIGVLLVLAAIGSPVLARGVSEVDFLAEFEQALGERGFTAEEAAAIAEAARSLDWSDGRRADPGVVADAVARSRDEGSNLKPDKQALLAQKLAESSVRLRVEGYEPSDVSVATVEAVSVLRDQINDWKASGSEEELGQIVRTTVASVARETARAQEQERAGNRGETARDQAPVGDTPGRPGR